MKLRNLFLASLAVCTMASCSKDDDGISGLQEVGRLSLFAPQTDAMTKASTEGDDDAGNGKEAKIQSLTAYVFDEAGKYVISKHVSLNGSGTVGEDYNVTGEGENQSITLNQGYPCESGKTDYRRGNSSTTFKVVLLANTEHYNDVTKLVDLEWKDNERHQIIKCCRSRKILFANAQSRVDCWRFKAFFRHGTFHKLV